MLIFLTPVFKERACQWSLKDRFCAALRHIFPSTVETVQINFISTLAPGSTLFWRFHTGRTEKEETIIVTICHHVSQAKPPLNLPHFTSFVIQITSWIFHSPDLTVGRREGEKEGLEQWETWKSRNLQCGVVLAGVMSCLATGEARACVQLNTSQPKNSQRAQTHTHTHRNSIQCVYFCCASIRLFFYSFRPSRDEMGFFFFSNPSLGLSVFCILRRNLLEKQPARNHRRA